ncbi:hypothetical protein PP175_29620 (plasmid) [Aneurinibacillus sp. Ricciae_BoGa-3]|uniref:hypothetical protein n=1 Tax=Aneurinibacillus sp. Ricciae_BoGa-3 TaxID=3022697 RepID=UPI00234169BC|nr:hypothetical protein [Aneurinibacillus sp. Ricciae_BoGa-3]WCK57352.1 hypothetical protein PP175_29620 [Aneurinibacillus sp. Ricciae_BoGa-3]
MKNKLIFLIGLFIFVGMVLLNGFGPYNVITALTANDLAGYPEIQEQLDGKIKTIKYIGRDTYQIHTDKKDYVLIDNGSNREFLRFKVFELNKKIDIFKNPM